MKLEINEYKAVMPNLFVGQPKIFKIILNEKVNDCIIETERDAKANGGKFKQYKLFLESETKEKYEANFLFAQQLRALVGQYGEDTVSWNNSGVELSGSPKQVNGKEFTDLVLNPIPIPHSWNSVSLPSN